MRSATTAATHTTAATTTHTTAANMHTTTASSGMTATAAATGMAATAATGMAATAAFGGGGVCRSRQRGRKNNGGESEFGFRHNFPRSVRTFAGTSLMFMNVPNKAKLH